MDDEIDVERGVIVTRGNLVDGLMVYIKLTMKRRIMTIPVHIL